MEQERPDGESQEPGDRKPLPPPRIYGIVAREAQICVIFRRGPSKYVQTLRWNTKTDEITPGQWLRARIYEKDGDLSPDGQWMTYCASRHGGLRSGEQHYTVVSWTPYLKALALWFHRNPWTGGALFESNSKILLNTESGSFDPDPDHPCRLETAPLDVPREEHKILRARLERDGWTSSGSPKQITFEREVSGFLLRHEFSNESSKFMLRNPAGESRPLPFEWLDVDCTGQIVAAREGKLWKASAESLFSDNVSEVADLAKYQYEPVPAPEWAARWEK